MADRPSHRSFGVTVLAGLAGATLAAVAAAQDWASASGRVAGARVSTTADGSESAPLALALALVALAAWGVVLVSRGHARRVVAAVGALAAVGVLAAVLPAFSRTQDDAVEALVARGATGDTFTASLTGWYVATAVGAVVALGAFLVAVRQAPRWPAMGSRYDAPAARPESDQDLWKALDDGRDPTT
jgi:uncharacterized membrane protein (TIGR02234 family)